MLDDHAPYQRVISDQTSAVDRQWLGMLSEAFAGTSADGLLNAGLDAELVKSFLGVVALDVRLNRADEIGHAGVA